MDDFNLNLMIGISERGYAVFKIGDADPISVPPAVARDIGQKIIAAADAIEGRTPVMPIERSMCRHPRKARKVIR